MVVASGAEMPLPEIGCPVNLEGMRTGVEPALTPRETARRAKVAVIHVRAAFGRCERLI
jgi:hypothetical protein